MEVPQTVLGIVLGKDCSALLPGSPRQGSAHLLGASFSSRLHPVGILGILREETEEVKRQ